MSDIHSADLNLVKHKGFKYIPKSMLSKSDALDSPIPEVADKLMHGIFHPQLAQFLCPARKLNIFDEESALYVFHDVMEDCSLDYYYPSLLEVCSCSRQAR
jgi:hypothetical protein